MSISKLSSEIDLAAYKAKLAVILYLPRLLLVITAIVLLFMLAFSIRALLMLLATYLIPLIASNGVEIWESLSGLAHMSRGMVGIISVSVAPLFLGMAVIPMLYCRAFFSFSPAIAIVSIMLLLPVVAVFNVETPYFAKRVTMAALVPSTIFGLYIGIVRLSFRDRIGKSLLHARRTPPIEELYRYGFTQLRRTGRNALIFVGKLTLPLTVLVLAFAMHGMSQLGSKFDPTGIMSAAQLILFMLLVFIVRPFVANSIRTCIRDLKQRNAETATFVYSIDKRPRVLLLRSFRDDLLEVPVKRSFDQVIYGLSAHNVRLEELLVEVSYRYGPVGTLQDPDAQLRPLGAARDLSQKNDWQNYIEDAISRAAVIMLIVGDTASLEWEIEKVKNLGRLDDTILIFPPKGAEVADRNMEIACQILGDKLPAIPNGRVPIIAFCDSARTWQLVISNEHGAIDYQEGLTIAFELQANATARRGNSNYWPVLKIGSVAAACFALAGSLAVHVYNVHLLEEQFNEGYFSEGDDFNEVIENDRKMIKWAEAHYPVSVRDSHINESLANIYRRMAMELFEVKRYEEASTSIQKSNEYAKLSAENAKDSSRSLITISDNNFLQSRIMRATGSPVEAKALIDDSIAVLKRVVALRPEQRYYRRVLSERLLARGDIHLESSRFTDAVVDYEAAWNEFNVNRQAMDIQADGERHEKSEIEGEEQTESVIIASLGYGYFYSGYYAKAESFLTQRWEQDHRLVDLLFIHISRLKRGLVSIKWLEQRAVQVEDKKWPYPMLEMYLGVKSVEEATAEADENDKQCEADFYVSQLYLVRSTKYKAVERLKAVVASCPHTTLEYRAAFAELHR